MTGRSAGLTLGQATKLSSEEGQLVRVAGVGALRRPLDNSSNGKRERGIKLRGRLVPLERFDL